MKNQFVPYELAVKLKELGFAERCIAYYSADKQQLSLIQGYNSLMFADYVHISNTIKAIPAPLWQQAFDWFRVEKDLLNHLTTHLNTWGEDGSLEESYGYRIMINKDGWKCDVWEQLSRYETYEEARQACLEKLIELCQQN